MTEKKKKMPHDNSYKLLFSHPEMIEDLLRGFVKEEWVAHCDFSTLENMPQSYVSDDLRDRHDDIIWRIRCGQEWFYVYLILEFQSSIDDFMAVRILSYVGLLYQDLVRTKKVTTKDRLPPVMPIVLYNGIKPWHAPTQLSQLIYPAPLGLEAYQPKIRYLLLDEGRFDKDGLSHINNLVSALFQLESSRSDQDIREAIECLIEWLQSPDQASLRRAFTVWCSRVLLPRKAPNSHFTEFNNLQEVKTMLAETIKNWENQGIEKGVEKGIVEGEVKLFIVALNSKFGALTQSQQDLVNASSQVQIEGWMKHIFQATSVDELLATHIE